MRAATAEDRGDEAGYYSLPVALFDGEFTPNIAARLDRKGTGSELNSGKPAENNGMRRVSPFFQQAADGYRRPASNNHVQLPSAVRAV
jgi:hypothetical protein